MKLNNVVNRINGNVDRFTTELEYYVGGEHFESRELSITKRGLIKPNLNILGFKFHFAFQTGDVLFMARNPHLRKAGMVMFDGLCSDASYILRTKDENILSQKYLAVLLQTDHFWDYCESHKVGSVNFAINWNTLANYEFELPSIEEQRVLADKLWAAYELKEAYKKMIAATDEMVKSQFIEMFEDHNYTSVPLAELIDKSFPGEWGTEDENGNGTKVIRTTNITNSDKLDLSDVVTRNIVAAKLQKKQLCRGDILLERSGGTKDNPVGRVAYFDEDGVFVTNNFTQTLRCNNNIESRYLFYFLYYFYNLNKMKIRSMGNQTTGIQNLNMDDYMQISVIVPPRDLQKQFISIVTQADKSKLVLLQIVKSLNYNIN